ncbi:MAG: hypothetical protein K0S58_1539 [Nitrospira sp.]|nr:hypothetical protein [Nitrospira sp.]
MTSATRRLSKTHTILGAVLMAPLLVTTVTGIMLGWYDQLRYATEPYGLSSPSEARLSATALVTVIQNHYPNHRLETLFMAVESSRAARAKLGSPSPLTVFLHPASGSILGTRTLAQRDWVDLLYDLHPGKTFGVAGQVTTAVTAFGIAVLWGLGIAMWYGRRASAVKTIPALSWRIIGFHRWAGFWLGLPFIALTGLGAALNFAGSLIATFDPPPKVIPIGPRPSPLGLASLAETHAPLYRPAALERIVFPKQDTDPVQLRYADGGWVFLDGYRGRVLDLKRPLDHWARSLYTLHSGRFFGVGGPWLVACLGLVLLAAVATGIVFSWRLRPSFRARSTIR